MRRIMVANDPHRLKRVLSTMRCLSKGRKTQQKGRDATTTASDTSGVRQMGNILCGTNSPTNQENRGEIYYHRDGILNKMGRICTSKRLQRKDNCPFSI
jgi:hypothetical protein